MIGPESALASECWRCHEWERREIGMAFFGIFFPSTAAAWAACPPAGGRALR